MHDLSQVLKKGTLLILETGEYSDSSWHGPVRMLKDATKADLAEAFASEWSPPAEYPDDKPEPHDFMPWLIKSGYAETVEEIASWHVGSYGEFRP